MPIVHCLESPKDKRIKYGIILIEGWAFSTTSSIQKIQVKCGKNTYLPNINITREDVAKCHSQFYENAIKSGFRLEIKLNDKEKNMKQKINIMIITEDETLSLDSIELVPEYSNQDIKINKADNFKNAIYKTGKYIKAGKFPKNFYEFKLCIQKFNAIIKTKDIQPSIINKNINMDPYEVWQLKNELDDRKIKGLNNKNKEFIYKPLISIIMPAYEPDITIFKKAIESVRNQIYENWELVIVDDYSEKNRLSDVVEEYSTVDKRIIFSRLDKNSNISIATNKAVEMCKGEFIFLMDHDDTIEKNALFEVINTINNQPNVDIIYSDDDKISMDGVRYDPQFKPDYSPELLLSYMYFSHIFVIRKTLFEEIGGCRVGYEGAQDYDLALRATEKTCNIVHIPKVLYHWRATPTSTATSAKTKPESIIRGKKSLEEAIVRRHIPAKVVIPDFAEKANLGIFALKYNADNYPKVSIIIPTKNHKEVLKRCLDSIIEKSTYPNYEIIIVDNYSDDQTTIEYLEKLPYKIIKCENVRETFNFSKLVNVGVNESNGEYVILLNNDTEVISESWIEDMLVYTKIDGVGITGSKLLYPDGTVQHAGVVIKMFNDLAGHAFKLIPEWDGGYLSYANVARNYSAVTAACFMVKKDIYYQVGGFDEDNFSVSFNDVDFCLKVIKQGYRVVYNPQALLYHHEGKSRGVEQTGHFSDAKEEYNFITKWNINTEYNDKYYNPNLSLENEKFEVDYASAKFDITDMNGINVLLITHNLNYEGAPLMQLNIAKGLMRYGYKFFVISMVDGPLKREYENIGAQVFIENINPGIDFLSFQSYRGILENLKQVIKHLEIKLIYTNTIETFFGVKLGEINNIPTIWGIHESVNYRNYFSNINDKIAKEAIEQFSIATKVVYVADATAKMYSQLNTTNFITIKNGINLEQIESYIKEHNRDSMRNKMNISKETRIISIFGAVCMRKGQKIFAEAAKLLLDKNIKDIQFYIIGAKDSTYVNELINYIKKNNFMDKIKVIYTCEDIFQYYLISDFFVCASYEESSPQVILEAMAFNLPIVSTNVFGIPELVRNEREALLIEPGDSIELANKLEVLLENEDLCKQLVYNGYYRVRTKFTYNIMIEKYNHLFHLVYQEGNNKIYRMLNK